MELYTFTAIIVLSVLLYKYMTRNFNYWKERDIAHLKPIPIFGNFYDVFSLRKNLGHHLQKLYNTFDKPYFGVYIFTKPVLVLKDPEIIKAVLVKDFNYFYDRNMLSDEKLDPMASQFLFAMKNPEWKLMRTKMSPVFTTGKIKNMFDLMNNVGDGMIKYMRKFENEPSLEMKEICSKFSTDVITTCAFGIEAHSFECEDAQFRSIGKKIFDVDWKGGLQQLTYMLAPQLAKFLNLAFLDPKVGEFLRNVFWDTLKDRENGKFKRNDLIDIILQIKNKNTFKESYAFEGDRVVAQAAQFFAAGFETVSSTMAFTLYELSLQPKLQERLVKEIKSLVTDKGAITYEAIQDMKYLHMVICETLRKYPVLPFLDRTCIKDYQIPGTKTIIEQGTPIYIPLFGLHFDPQYFPEPKIYDPERFNDSNKGNLASFSYLPFGDGPRNCIGERFGLIGTKLGLVSILREYEVATSADTPVPIVFDPKMFVLASTVGLPMKIARRVSIAA